VGERRSPFSSNLSAYPAEKQAGGVRKKGHKKRKIKCPATQQKKKDLSDSRRGREVRKCRGRRASGKRKTGWRERRVPLKSRGIRDGSLQAWQKLPRWRLVVPEGQESGGHRPSAQDGKKNF